MNSSEYCADVRKESERLESLHLLTARQHGIAVEEYATELLVASGLGVSAESADMAAFAISRNTTQYIVTPEQHVALRRRILAATQG